MSASRHILNKSLKNKLIDLIRIKGPISVSDYMKIVLTNPESGFYMNEDVFGVKGHFTTNPEISQMFGEIIGAWIFQEWKRYGFPKPLRLIEFGPGRGTLASDITRTLKKFNPDPGLVQLRLIEVSPKLRQVQQQTLSQQKNLVDDTRWHQTVEGVEDEDKEISMDGFSAYIAHEFLDALPIHKFVREPKTKRWRELQIDYDQREELRFCIGRQPSLAAHLLIPEHFAGDHIEICPEAALTLERVSKRINETQKGCMLICDYGFEDQPEPPSLQVRSARDTFRAFKNHQPWHPLKDPGDADLTADVDFGYLKRHMKDKSLVFGSVTQKDFLLKCGLEARLNNLLSATADHEEMLKSEANMMINDMGQRYRFMAIFPRGHEHKFKSDPPAGFSSGERP